MSRLMLLPLALLTSCDLFLVDDNYTPCGYGSDACLGDDACIFAPNARIPHVSACAAPCRDDGDCAPPIAGEAVPTCAIRMESNEQGFCVLTCIDDADCPSGMACTEVDTHGPFASATCGWPFDDGATTTVR